MSPNFQNEFVLQTDASDRGVGAVLSQLDDEGNDRPIAYYSHKLLPREESIPLWRRNAWPLNWQSKPSTPTSWVKNSESKRTTGLWSG